MSIDRCQCKRLFPVPRYVPVYLFLYVCTCKYFVCTLVPVSYLLLYLCTCVYKVPARYLFLYLCTCEVLCMYLGTHMFLYLFTCEYELPAR